MSFKNIIGNDDIKHLLIKTIESNKVSHSYMFCGIEGIGKRLFAKEFANMILCNSTPDTKPCGSCKSCIEMKSNNHPDFYEINVEENTIKIEQIRLMQAKVLEKPIISNKKVYIINNADTMTREAANCLLKTLEEPPGYVCIILIVSNENALLNTIRSRCTKVTFKPIDNRILKQYIQNTYHLEDVSSTLIEACGGSIKKLMQIIENKDAYQKLDSIFNNIENTNLLDALNNMTFLYEDKEKIYEILEYINTIFYNKVKNDIRYVNYIQSVEETKKNLKANANYDMAIDKLLFSIYK